MFGLSAGHLLILGAVLLLFGPKRLPELGSTLGQAIRNFKGTLGGPDNATPENKPAELRAEAPAPAEHTTASAEDAVRKAA